MRRTAMLLIITVGFVSACGEDASPLHDVPSDVRDCKQRLREIYKGLVEFDERFDGAPPSPGVGFFGELLSADVWTPDQAALLTCPGPGAQIPAAEIDFTLPHELTGTDSAYAGRDVEAHPFESFPCGGPVVVMACDNANGMNHVGVMNVLYADGSIRTLELARLIEQGKLPAGTTTIVVGPASPIKDLRTLAAD